MSAQTRTNFWEPQRPQRKGLSLSAAQQSVAGLRPGTLLHPDAVADVKAAFAWTWESDLTKGIVLTEDYNPVEYYDAANREKLRR